MANTFAPNGFQQYQGTGSSPTFEQTQLAISSANTNPIFFGDPVVQAASATGVGTGYITQGYGPVALTVGATGVATNAAGAIVVTFSAAVPTSGGALPATPNAWAPPIGSVIVITGATTASGQNLNGVYPVTSSTTGTATSASAAALTPSVTSTAVGSVYVYVPVAGVFVGCRYLSAANKYPIWRNYWPGSDANGDVQAYVITDPNAQFSVATGNSNTTATPVGFNQIGQNIAYAYVQNGIATTNGVTATGVSSFFADAYTLIANFPQGAIANSLLPFRVIALANYVPGAVSPLVSINGNDQTTAYNRVIVAFNNSMPRQFAGV